MSRQPPAVEVELYALNSHLALGASVLAGLASCRGDFLPAQDDPFVAEVVTGHWVVVEAPVPESHRDPRRYKRTFDRLTQLVAELRGRDGVRARSQFLTAVCIALQAWARNAEFEPGDELGVREQLWVECDVAVAKKWRRDAAVPNPVLARLPALEERNRALARRALLLRDLEGSELSDLSDGGVPPEVEPDSPGDSGAEVDELVGDAMSVDGQSPGPVSGSGEGEEDEDDLGPAVRGSGPPRGRACSLTSRSVFGAAAARSSAWRASTVATVGWASRAWLAARPTRVASWSRRARATPRPTASASVPSWDSSPASSRSRSRCERRWTRPVSSWSSERGSCWLWRSPFALPPLVALLARDPSSGVQCLVLSSRFCACGSCLNTKDGSSEMVAKFVSSGKRLSGEGLLKPRSGLRRTSDEFLERSCAKMGGAFSFGIGFALPVLVVRARAGVCARWGGVLARSLVSGPVRRSQHASCGSQQRAGCSHREP